MSGRGNAAKIDVQGGILAIAYAATGPFCSSRPVARLSYGCGIPADRPAQHRTLAGAVVSTCCRTPSLSATMVLMSCQAIVSMKDRRCHAPYVTQMVLALFCWHLGT